MWFKNLIIYQFETLPDLQHEALSAALESGRFTHCGPQDVTSIGWTSPLGNPSDELIHSGSNFCLLSARLEQRLLPATVVREALNEKVLQIEAAEQRKVSRKQKSEIRDELIFSMTPKAFTRSTRITGMILPNENLLIVDSASRPRAEDWITLLRESLGSLEVTPLEFNQSVSALLTGWLNGQTSLPSTLQLGDECLLQSPDDVKSKVRLQGQDLGENEIRAHLDAGKYVTRLQLHWQESLSFVFTEAAELKRLVFHHGFTDQAGDAAAELDTIASLMSLEFTRIFAVLFRALGGEDLNSPGSS